MQTASAFPYGSSKEKTAGTYKVMARFTMRNVCPAPGSNWCCWNYGIICMSGLSVVCVLFVLTAHIRNHRKCCKGRRQNSSAAHKFERMLCAVGTMLLVADVCYHVVDLIFVTDIKAPPMYVAMHSTRRVTKALENANLYQVFREAFGIVSLWCHASIARMLSAWMLHKHLRPMRLRCEVLLLVFVAVVTTLRISLKREMQKGTYLIEVTLFNGIIVPVMVLIIVAWHARTIRHVSALEREIRAIARSRRSSSQESMSSMEDGRMSETEEVEKGEDTQMPGSESRPPEEVEERHEIQAQDDVRLLQLAQLHTHLCRIACVLPAVWLTCSITEMCIWGYWAQHSQRAHTALYWIRLAATRMIGAMDAWLVGPLCVNGTTDTITHIPHTTQRRSKPLRQPVVESPPHANGDAALPPLDSTEFTYARSQNGQ